MAFQSQDLAMLGVGIDDFRQPGVGLPEVPDGIHLRWSFARERGFPWFGYYLFRRDRFQAKPRCYSAHRPKRKGPQGRRKLRLPGTGPLEFGIVTSDRNLVTTAAGDLDLNGREVLRLALPERHPAHQVSLELRLRARTRIRVRFLHLGRTIGSRLAVARLGPRTVELSFEADTVDAVEISGGRAVLRELCYVSIRDSAADRPGNVWQPLADFTYPLMMPVRGPDYFPAGPADSGQALRLAMPRLRTGDPDHWRHDSFRELHDLLRSLVAGAPGQMHQQILAGLAGESEQPGAPAPGLGGASPLDLVLLAALSPQVAQMVGLYHVDEATERGKLYDYCLIADHDGRCRGQTARARGFLAALEAFDGPDMDFTFIGGRSGEDSPHPEPPEELKVFAPPEAPATTGRRAHQAGFNWQLEQDQTPPPDAAVFFHLWRQRVTGGDDFTQEPQAEGFAIVTAEQPILFPDPEAERAAPPPDWPPEQLFAIDRVAREGWYSYRATAVDVFGPNSRLGETCTWFQWQPRPRPRPWYFDRDAGDGPVTGLEGAAFAVRLLDKTPPPRPAALTASLLDAEDPLLVRDRETDRWLAEHPGRGLRVCWSWPQTHAHQAPDTREFRVYFRAGLFNTLFARVRSAEPDGDGFSRVILDVSGEFPSSLWQHCRLNSGNHAYEVVDGRGVPGSDPGLELRLANVGPRREIHPRPGDGVGLVFPSFPAPGRVRVREGSTTVVPEGPAWDPRLQGLAFRLAAEPEAAYGVSAISRSGRKVVLNRPFREPSGSGLDVRLEHVHAAHPERPGAWSARLDPIAVDNPSSTTFEQRRDRRGRPLEGSRAEVQDRRVRLRPAPAMDTVRPGIDALLLERGGNRDGPFLIVEIESEEHMRVAGRPRMQNARWRVVMPVHHYQLFAELPEPLDTSPGQPMAYAQVGVSAADDRGHVADRFRRADPPRPGNESRVAGPVAVFAVHRQPPPAAEPPDFDQERLYATVADYQGRSSFEVPFRRPAAGLEVVVYRALDESLYRVARDLELSISENDRDLFPAQWFRDDPVAGAAMARAVAAELASAAGSLEALRGLSDLALRVLAALPGAEAAYSQLTTDPLAAEAAAAGFPDRLDGRAANRYFYRTSLVDAAGNRGPMGEATPPVYLPRLFPPASPVAVGVRGMDRGVLIHVALPVDAEVHRLDLYRTGDTEAAHDLRLMGEPVASLPARPLITRQDPQHGVTLDVSVLDLVEAVTLYPSEGFDPRALPLDDQVTAPLTSSLPDPEDGRLGQLGLAPDLEVVLVYRDPRGALQCTPAPGQPLRHHDAGLDAPRDWAYRLVAVRTTGSAEGPVEVRSEPSPALLGRALALSLPSPPALTAARWVLLDGDVERDFDPDNPDALTPALVLTWESPFAFVSWQVQRAPAGSAAWRFVSPALPAESASFTDTAATPDRAWRYRVRGTDATGRVNLEYHELDVPIPGVPDP